MMQDRNWPKSLLFSLLGTTVALIVLLSLQLRQSEADETDGVDFDTQIAPLLARRCLDCHNSNESKGELDLSRKAAVLTGGESGPALDLDNPAESLIWSRVADDEMPPEEPLSKAEKAILKKWISSGARWGTKTIDPFRFTTESRAGYDWWALQPVRRSPPPQVDDSAWTKNPIDLYILARLQDKELKPSAAANRRTLIRRLSFDLLGLPPAPEEVEAFVADHREDAYEQLVDQLLASPRYGERWARHWLDVVRFGESQGFERDQLRSNSWRYRDWVVDAFNRDMPYDEFAQRQLAGDVLYPNDPEGTIATGFLVAGAYDVVGQSQQSAAMRAVVRTDELEDIVSVVGQSFLGLTVNCARCHDHKFDPVRQSEYYQLTAALGGVRHGERELNSTHLSETSQRLAVAMTAQADSLRNKIAAIETPIRNRILQERKTNLASAKPPTPIARWDFDGDLKDRAGSLNASLHDEAKIVDGKLKVVGNGFASTTPIKKDIKEKTLEAWVRLDNLTQQGGAAISLQTLDGQRFDAIVFGEQVTGKWMAGSDGFSRTQQFNGPDEKQADKQFVHFAIVYQADGRIIGYRNGQPYGKSYQSSGPNLFRSGEAQVIFGLRHGSPGGNRLLSGQIDRAQLYDRALSPIEVAASAGTQTNYVSDEEIAAQLTTEQLKNRQNWRFEIERLESLKNRQVAMRVYAVLPKHPATTHVLLRGNPAQKAEMVKPGGIASLVGVEADFHLAADAPEGERRIKLAKWISDWQNPMFARTMVNRLWHHHFGVGIVETPNDFGFNGARPSHPQLLDYLALELVESGGSLKSIQRMIVTSATYRQTSLYREEAADKDAGNRWLWRKTPLRLEAEAVRDAILAVADVFNSEMGGPGFEDFRTFTRNTQFYEMLDPVGHSFNRRSLYRTWVRSGRNRFLDVFDCPDPSTKTPRRAVTTTPLQALSMMNHSFVLRMSDRFSQRLQVEGGDEPAEQVERAYRVAYGRTPSKEEAAILVEFVREHGLPALCRVLFNSNEFLYID